MKEGMLRFLGVAAVVLGLVFLATGASQASGEKILLVCNEDLYNYWEDHGLENPIDDTYIPMLEAEEYEIVSNFGDPENSHSPDGKVLLAGDERLDPYWTPTALRDYIVNKWDNGQSGLAGCVLIGDVAVPDYQYVPDGQNKDPLDIAYMDMDGTWKDSEEDVDHFFDSRSGSYDTPEIWLGRITPSSLVKSHADDDSRPYWYGGSSFATQAQIIHTYFQRVNAYRAGTLTRSQGALVYNDDDQVDEGSQGVDCLYTDWTLVDDKNTTIASDYKDSLAADYEWVHNHSHGSATSTSFHTTFDNPYTYPEHTGCNHTSDYCKWRGGSLGGYGDFTQHLGSLATNIHIAGDSPDVQPVPLFYFADNCLTSRYTAENYLGGCYIFHPTATDHYGLLVIGHTVESYADEETPFYTALFASNTIGEAFRKSNRTIPASTGDPGLGILENGMTLLGDPTLKVIGSRSAPDLTIIEEDIQFQFPQPVPNAGETITIKAIIANRGTSIGTSFSIRFYDGDPEESGYVVIGTELLDDIGASERKSVELDWNTTGDMYGEHQIFIRVDVYGNVTEDDEGNNEASKPIRLHLYQTVFPKPIEGAYSYKVPPVLADCDDDGDVDIIIGKRCFKSDGTLMWTLDGVDEYFHAPAVGDLDGDGALEIVFCSMNEACDNGEIRVFDADTGEPKYQWDTYSPSGTPHITTSPTLADLDHDGKLEVIFGANDDYKNHSTMTTSKLCVISWNGGIGEWDDWDKEITPVETLSYCPAVGDVDGDGDLEIVVCTAGGDVYCYEKVGEDFLWQTDIEHTIVGPPVLADVDADGGLEVVLFGYTGDTPKMSVLAALNGNLKWNVEFESANIGTIRESVLSVGNLDADEFMEIVVNVTSTFGSNQYEPKIYVVHPNGTNGAPTLVKAFDTELSRGCVIGDVDEDGQMELVTVAGDWGYVIDPVSADVDSFPISRSAGMYSFPALGNLDGDAYPEIVFGAYRELHVVDYQPGTLGNVEWPMYQHDPRHTGLLNSKSGPLTGHEIWCGTVYVTGDVTVLDGAMLTIQPGTEVLFAANSDYASGGYSSSKCELIVQGKLVAEGTESNPITFRSTNTSNPTKSDWYGIRFDTSADPASVVDHCTIRDAWGGIYLRPSSNSPDITYNTITNCTRGVYGYSPQQITIEHNTLDYNTYGLYLNYAGTGNIQCNSASHNSSRGMVLYYCNPSNVSGNTVSYNGAYGGIRMNGSSCTPFMASNIVKHNGDGGIYGYGIYLCYGADATLASNKIGYNSSYGVKLYNASPVMNYYAYAQNATEHNGDCELYLKNSNPCLDYGHNDFVPDTALSTYYHIYIESGNAVTARGNWWGTNDPAAFSFYPADSVDYSSWSSSANTDGVGKIIASPGLAAYPGMDAYELLFKAIDFRKEGQYPEAARACEEVIEKYPDSPAAGPAMSGLLSAHRGMGGDLLALRAYYEGLSSSRAGTGLGRKARWLSIDCLELSGDCKGAIAEYQALRSGGGEEGVAAALRMGEVYLYGLRDLEAAGKVFEQILSEAPESEAASLASEHLAELRELSKLDPEPRSDPGAAKVSEPCPEEITLSSNWPNPFNPRTVITFALPEPAFVKLEVYNILGQRVGIPVEGLRQAGIHFVNWDGKNASGMEMASGVYFYRLVVDKGRFVQAKKMLLMR